jgi:hypothetical protein
MKAVKLFYRFGKLNSLAFLALLTSLIELGNALSIRTISIVSKKDDSLPIKNFYKNSSTS